MRQFSDPPISQVYDYIKFEKHAFGAEFSTIDKKCEKVTFRGWTVDSRLSDSNQSGPHTWM